MIASELVSQIMTKHVISVNIKDHLRHVIDLIKKEKIRHLPVVDGHQIKGIISSTDLNRLTFSNLFDQQDNSEDAILDMLSIDQVMQLPRLVKKSFVFPALNQTFTSSNCTVLY